MSDKPRTDIDIMENIKTAEFALPFVAPGNTLAFEYWAGEVKRLNKELTEYLKEQTQQSGKN